tara:strand:+ start:840 stop:1442 length:603 start_codon:yes stop_codon:yes gene_type:complete
MIEPFEVYRLYLAIKLHFTTKNYDIVKYRFKVRVKEETFRKRKDMVSIKKLARDYSRDEIINFLVANFVSGEKWGGLFDVDAARRYEEWQNRKVKREYQFQQDVDRIILEMEKENIINPFVEKNSKHPLTFRLFFGNIINIETMTILDKIFDFVDTNTNDILLEDACMCIQKYRPFVKVTDKMMSVSDPLKSVINRKIHQ